MAVACGKKEEAEEELRTYAALVGSYDLRIYDLEDPSDPELVSEATISFGSFIQDASLSGNYLYAITNAGVMIVTDLEEPSNPVLLCDTTLQWDGHSILTMGDRLFLAGYAGYGTFRYSIWDISSPCEPQLLDGYYTMGKGIRTLSSDGRVLGTYVGSYYLLFEVGGGRFGSVSMLSLGNTAHGAVYDGYAYVTNGDSLFVYGLSDPDDPQRVGAVSSNANLGIVDACGDYLYVADSSAGIVHIFSISDRENPEFLSYIFTGIRDIEFMDASDEVLCVGGQGKLAVIDVSDKEHPEKKALIDASDISPKDVIIFER